MTFEKKVRGMKFSKIMQSMIDGINAEHVKIDMDEWGVVKRKYLFWKQAYGCAATNTACEIAGVKFTTDNIESYIKQAKLINAKEDFYSDFRYAINELRFGNSHTYNIYALKCKIKRVPEEFIDKFEILLPLKSLTYKVVLPLYQKLCNEIKEAGY